MVICCYDFRCLRDRHHSLVSLLHLHFHMILNVVILVMVVSFDPTPFERHHLLHIIRNR